MVRSPVELLLRHEPKPGAEIPALLEAGAHASFDFTARAVANSTGHKVVNTVPVELQAR